MIFHAIPIGTGWGMEAAYASAPQTDTIITPIMGLRSNIAYPADRKLASIITLAIVASVCVVLFSSFSRTTMSSPTEFVKQTIQQNRVVVFSKTYCPYCRKGNGAFMDMRDLHGAPRRRSWDKVLKPAGMQSGGALRPGHLRRIPRSQVRPCERGSEAGPDQAYRARHPR